MAKVLSALLLLVLAVVFGAPAVKKGPCDETRECRRLTFSGSDRVLCFGYYGCKGANIDSDQKAICSGAKACMRARFTTNVESILCNGYASCIRGRDMTNNNKISCNGFKACGDNVGGLTAPIIMCDGDLACTNYRPGKGQKLALNLNAKGGPDSLLYCNGNAVCKVTQQRSDGLIYCDGDGACKGARMQATKIECQGKRGCKDAIMQPRGDVAGATLDEVQCQGFFGCSNTTIIQASYIRAPGFNSLAAATIETRGTDIVIEAYGFRALAGASIDCKGSTCQITCKGNACKGAPMAVARSSTLIISPEGCDPNSPLYLPSKKDPSLPAKQMGIHCPVIKYVTTEESEEEVAAWLEAMVNEYKDSEEYQEMLEMDDIAEQDFELYIEDRLRDFEDLNTYDYEEDDDEIDGQEAFLYGGNVAVQTQIASSLITSNLLTAIVVFLLTGGLIYCFVQYKYGNGYKQLPQ